MIATSRRLFLTAQNLRSDIDVDSYDILRLSVKYNQSHVLFLLKKVVAMDWSTEHTSLIKSGLTQPVVLAFRFGKDHCLLELRL